MNCTNCGAQIEEGQAFCAACGSALNVNKRFCKSCGAELAEGSAFCSGCGAAAEISGLQTGENIREDKPLSIFGKISAKFTDIVTGFGGELADRRAASLGWKHLLAGALFLVVIIFYFIPIMELRIPEISYGFFDEEVEWQISNISLSNPFAAIIESAGESSSDAAMVKTIFGAFIFIVDVIPLILAGLFAVLPVLNKKVLKIRGMIFQLIIAFRAVFAVIFNYGIWGIAVLGSTNSADKEQLELLEELNAFPSFNFNFFGILMIIALVALVVTLFVIRRENKRVFEAEIRRSIKVK